MAADNWGICPNCLKQGTIPEPYYQDEDVDGNPIPRTLREDYEIWVDPIAQKLIVDYRCSCHVCGFNKPYYQSVDIFKLPDNPIRRM